MRSGSAARLRSGNNLPVMQPITVATFNIHHGRGPDRKVDLGRTAAAINETQASLVALQELDVDLERSGRMDQPRVLEELTGAAIHFVPTKARGGSRYGIGVLLRDEANFSVESLPRLADEEPRVAIVTEWAGWSILATHLAVRTEARDVQLDALARIANGLRSPSVLLGDFNAGRRDLGPLIEAGFTLTPRPLRTIRRSFRREVDHILVGPGAQIVQAGTIRSRASDHFPVVATIVAL
jgi:endonuclease/exonuclease/phosphatase family metal-dependent hydrolase